MTLAGTRPPTVDEWDKEQFWYSKEAIDKVLKCAPEIQDDIALYTLYRGKEGTLVRRLSGKDAVEAQDNMGLELR